MINREYRIEAIEEALKTRYGNIAIVGLEDMSFFDYYDYIDGYWFKIFKNNTHETIRGIIVESMDDEFWIEECIA